MRRVTLSFDNGPWPGITDHVHRVLEQYAVLTTFFLVGERLRDPASRRLAEEAHSRGHWIGNHTMSHGEPLGLRQDADSVAQEIAQTDELLGDLAHTDRFFRPNGKGKIGPHLLSEAAVDYLTQTQSTVVLWTCVPKDLRAPRADSWVEEAKQAVMSQDWSLLVLHDRPSGHDIAAGSMAFLEPFLSWIRDSDIEIVQDFPDNCIPMRRGHILPSLDGLVTH